MCCKHCSSEAMASPYAGNLTEGEWKQLQQLLVKARKSGQLGEVCLHACVEGEEIAQQQRIWRANNPAAVEAYAQLVAAAEAKRVGTSPMKAGASGSAGMVADSTVASSSGCGSGGLSQATIDKIVNAASNEEERKIMAAMAATASADGTIDVRVKGPASAKKQRPDPPQLPSEQGSSLAIFPAESVGGGAMSDACKRRFDSDDEALLNDGFEMVTPTVYDPTDCQIDLATVIAETPAPSPAMAYGNRELGYQEGTTIVSEAERGWFPPIAADIYDAHIPLPPGVESHTEWGKTRIVMPKYKQSNYSYETAMRIAMGADYEMAKYLNFIVKKFGPVYLRHGSKTQASDLAGYLMRAKFRVGVPPLRPVQAPGFKREF